MERLRTWLIQITIALVVIVFVFMGLRSLVVTLWRTPDLPQTYFVEGEDGRAMAIVLMPDNYMFFSYNEPMPFYTELVLAKTRGEYGTQYLWNIWSVDRDAGWLSMRVLDDGQRPVTIEATVVDKFVDANPRLETPRGYFPEKGESRRLRILISDETLEFQRSTLRSVPNDVMFLLWLEERLPFPEVPQ